jgi:hypothetical protein
MQPRRSDEPYTASVNTVWQGRVTQAAARYGEVTQTAAVCCNACRTCVQTNMIAMGLAVAAGAGTWIARRVRRLAALLER